MQDTYDEHGCGWIHIVYIDLEHRDGEHEDCIDEDEHEDEHEDDAI
jgi:hypothetical protein